MRSTHLASVLAPLMLLAACKEQPAELIATPSINTSYTQVFNDLAPHAPGLTVVMLSPKDLLSKDDNYQDYNWAAFSSCDAIENDMGLVEANALLEKAQRKLSEILLSRGLVTDDEIIAAVHEDPSAYGELTQSIALQILQGEFSAYSLQAFSKKFRDNIAVVAVPESFDKDSFVPQLGGLSPDYIKPVPGTTNDWALLIMAHEINGHAHNGHTSDSPTYCATIDYKFLHQSILHESEADIAASKVFKAARPHTAAKGRIIETFWALRALGAFFINSNDYTLSNTPSVQGHLTSILFDPFAESLRNNRDITKQENLAGVPVGINNFADAFAGFLYIQQMKQKMLQSPNDFTAEEKEYYAALPIDPNQIALYLDSFAVLGEELRKGVAATEESEAIPARYEYHYAAMSYMRDHQWLERMQSLYLDDYGSSLKIFFEDYFRAANLIGSEKLRDEKLVADMNKVMAGFKDYELIISTLYPPEEEKAEAAPTPTAR